ncbi:hypothetical protein V6N13_058922 [Hibiscus sabdariffa]|uniref:KIB1-4 beta-propeller domain-containing protein n=1 Tax=Hibiscus sabdariffa TaxID=183260 RepID=A0ABR2GEN9_9ROSI
MEKDGVTVVKVFINGGGQCDDGEGCSGEDFRLGHLVSERCAVAGGPQPLKPLSISLLSFPGSCSLLLNPTNPSAPSTIFPPTNSDSSPSPNPPTLINATVALPTVGSFNYSRIGKEYSLLSPSGDPYTRNLRQMRDSFIKKIVLSDNPSKELRFVVVAIPNQTVHKQGGIVICDVNHDSPRVSFVRMLTQVGGDLQYLINSGDELLLVTRHLDLEFSFKAYESYLVYRTKRFDVVRLVWSEPHWERVKSLHDKMVFIGENSSLSLSATKFTGCRGECISFTDDYSESNYDGAFREHDIGIYKLWDGSFEPLPCYPRNSLFRLRWPTPLWVTPSPY